MTGLNYSSIRNIIEGNFFEVFERLKRNLQKTSEKLRVRNESNENESTIQYLIEIVDLKKLNDDDYGLIGCINIGCCSNEIIIRIEIFKSDGPIISTKEYKLLSINDELYNTLALNRALSYLNNLPEVLHSTFLSIY